MNERETAAKIASALFGATKAEDESSEPEATEPQPGAEPSQVEDRSPRGDQPSPEGAAAQHNELLAQLFASSEAKREADEQFFSAPGFRVEPPGEGE